VEVDYKNEFYLKNGQSVKLVLKYLTYRMPGSEKNIESHTINLSLLRNTIHCSEKKLLIEPSSPDINRVLVFYRLIESIVEIELEEELSTLYSQNHFVAVLHGSSCKWFKNRLVVSINCTEAGRR
jgi:hypothetical protein